MLDLGTIDRSSDRPPYRQIADILREHIDRGRLAPGEQLPSEATLIGHFGVAWMTVREAIKELRTEGLVVAYHGKGAFVRSAPRSVGLPLTGSQGGTARKASPPSSPRLKGPATYRAPIRSA